MTGQKRDVLYRQELQYLKKHGVAVHILNQLKKKDPLLRKELHKTANENRDDKIPQKTFEAHLKKMIMHGLVYEIFTNDLKFKIILSPIGKDIHNIIRKTSIPLVTTN